MTKTELAKQIEQKTGTPLASINQLCKALRIGRKVLYRYLDGLEFVGVGTTKKYLIADVAERIVSGKKITEKGGAK